MFSSIRTRLTFSHLAVIIVAMSLSGFLLFSLLERYFLQAMEDSLAAQAQITTQALIPGAIAGGPSVEVPVSAYNTIQQQRVGDISLQAENVAPQPAEIPLGDVDLDYLTDASLQLSSQLDTRIRILDAHGIVLVDSHQEEKGTNLQDDPLAARALAGEVASQTSQAGREPVMDLAAPILVEGKLVGAVYLSQPLRDVTKVVRDLRTRWLLSTVVALLFSAVVGLLLSGAIARPLRRLTSAAGSVARGQFDQPVPVRSRDELGRLSQAFNEMTARLRAARQIQVDFVANVSHELRTPLTAVKGLVETLRDGAVDDPQVRDRFLETMEGETDRLIRLVNDLLVLSRADSEALDLQRDELDITELVQMVVDRIAPQAEARNLHLCLEAGQSGAVQAASQGNGLPDTQAHRLGGGTPQGTPQVPLVLADADRIEQVLVNLLDNAIKYSRPTGTVTVRIEGGRESEVRVQVQDEGIGIPAEDLQRIGERFYRADRARSRAEGGSGLGLAIAQALVQAHGGRLWLESREGRGTLVTFSLPTPSCMPTRGTT